ncbi:MAG: transglutaminase domain-containing protein [Chloroflexota bacterium]
MIHQYRLPKNIRQNYILFFTGAVVAGSLLFFVDDTGWLLFLGAIWLPLFIWSATLLIYGHQTIRLAEQQITQKKWFSTRTSDYQDIYYVRFNPTKKIGVTLVTRQGQIHIPVKLAEYRQLLEHLEKRAPKLLTPSIIEHPLPLKVFGNKEQIILLSIGSLLFGAMSGYGFISMVSGASGNGFFAVIFGLFFCVFVYTLLTGSRYFLFTETRIIAATYLKQRIYDTAQITRVSYENREVKSKNGTRTVHDIIVTFKDSDPLEISNHNVSYPFFELLEIVQQHYSPQSYSDIPWRKYHKEIDPNRFGRGSTRSFDWYFSGESLVEVKTVTEICNWLTRCQYRRDNRLFMESDFWQHPVTFEQIRLGDCEDHALWAWRKLAQLGIEAEFVVGHMKSDYHAWVFFEQDGQHYLFEATDKRGKIVQPIEKAKDNYLPEYSVNSNFETFFYHVQPPTSTPD